MELVSKFPYIPQIRANDYGTVSIKDNRRPNFVNKDNTSIQKKIELSVTNGRGYETLLEAINTVNLDVPDCIKVSLYDAYDKGLVPLYFTGPKKDIFPIPIGNPCGEISLGESYECEPFMKFIRPPTLVEQLQTIVRAKQHEKCRRRGVFS